MKVDKHLVFTGIMAQVSVMFSERTEDFKS